MTNKNNIEEFKNKIICGDALTELKKLSDNSIDCIVTSPPYWGLRNYNVEGQIGLEPTLEEYLEKLLQITAELKRILKPSGTMFWVHGDCYGGSGTGAYKNPPKEIKSKEIYHLPYDSNPEIRRKGEIGKCLMLQNVRLLIRMIDEQRWILRNILIWYKPNHMPSPTRDRFTNSYEPVFYFVKSKRNFFDLDSIRVPIKQVSIERMQRGVSDHHKYTNFPEMGGGGGLNKPRPNIKRTTHYPEETAENFGSPRARYWRKLKEIQKYSGSPGRRAQLNMLEDKLTTQVKKRLKDVGDYLKMQLKSANLSTQDLSELTGLRETTIAHYFRTDASGQALPDRKIWDILKPLLNLGDYDEYIDEEIKNALPQPHPLGKNPGDVFFVSTKPFKESHFAVFPEELITPFIIAGCPENGIVLDPFMGAGTTGVVALKLNRNFVGIELNPEYIKIAEKRIKPYLENLKQLKMF